MVNGTMSLSLTNEFNLLPLFITAAFVRIDQNSRRILERGEVVRDRRRFLGDAMDRIEGRPGLAVAVDPQEVRLWFRRACHARGEEDAHDANPIRPF